MKLALGTAQLGLNYGIANQTGKIKSNEGRTILKHAEENGILTLDTAIAYGDSEQRLGEIGVQNWQVVSKLPSLPEDCDDPVEWVSQVVKDSLNRLNINKLYGLLLHRPIDLLNSKGKLIYQSLQKLKTDGVVQNIGISIYDPSELELICNQYQIDIVQAPFNIIDRRLLLSGWLLRLYEQGIELHVRSVFLQGLLLMAPRERMKRFRRWESLWKQYDGWLSEIEVTPLDACLQYPLSFKEISKVIVGVDSLDQFKDIIQATKTSVLSFPDSLAIENIDLVDPSRWAKHT